MSKQPPNLTISKQKMSQTPNKSNNEVVLLGTSLKWITLIAGIDSNFLKKIYERNCRFSFVNETDKTKHCLNILIEADLPNVDGNYVVKRKIVGDEYVKQVKDIIKIYKKANKKIISAEIVAEFKNWRAKWINSLILTPLNQEPEEITVVAETNQTRWLLREKEEKLKTEDDAITFDGSTILEEPAPNKDEDSSLEMGDSNSCDNYKWDSIDFNFDLGVKLNGIYDRRGQYSVLKSKAIYIRNLFITHVVYTFVEKSKKFISSFPRAISKQNELKLEIQNFCKSIFNENEYYYYISEGQGALDESLKKLKKYFDWLQQHVGEFVTSLWNSLVSSYLEQNKTAETDHKPVVKSEVEQILKGENNNFKPKKVRNYCEAFLSELKRTKNIDLEVDQLTGYIVEVCKDEKIVELVSKIYPDEVINEYVSRIQNKEEDIGLLEVLILSEIFCINVSFLSNDLSKSTKINCNVYEDMSRNVVMFGDSKGIYAVDDPSEDNSPEDIKCELDLTYYIKLNNKDCEPKRFTIKESTNFTEILDMFDISKGYITVCFPNNIPPDIVISDAQVLDLVKNKGLSFFWIEKKQFKIYFALDSRKEYVYDFSLIVGEVNSLKQMLDCLQPAQYLGEVKIILENNQFNNYKALCDFFTENHVKEIKKLIIESKWNMSFELPNIPIETFSYRGKQLRMFELTELGKKNIKKVEITSKELSINDFIEIRKRKLLQIPLHYIFDKKLLENKIKNSLIPNDILTDGNPTTKPTEKEEVKEGSTDKEEEKENAINYYDNGDVQYPKQKESFEKKLTGEGIKIAVIDSGCDLSSNYISRKNIIAMKTFNSHKNNKNFPAIVDLTGHGTGCCGIIVGDKKLGIAPEAQLIVAKSIYNTDYVNALRWAWTLGADIYSLSIGYLDHYSKELHDTIQEIILGGGVVVCSAANQGMRKNAIAFPAKYGNTICVGSHDDSGTRSNFSSVGREIDLLAPGEKILSTYSSFSPKFRKFAVGLDGTSFASPFVAGVCAIIMSKYKETKGKKLDQQQMKLALEKLCDSSGYHTQERGYGILNVENLNEKFFECLN